MLQATRKERIAVLSLNIFVRPEGIHSGKWFQSGDHKNLRVSLLLRKMKDLDIVILQEMFEVGSRQRRFVREAFDMGFKYHCGSVWPNIIDRYVVDGGLLILSRFPIVERDQLAFSQGSGADGICSKGVLYARVQLSPDLADSLHVFTTHTQAGDRLPEYSIRAAQLKELSQFVGRTIREDPSAPVLITGDFNLDARHNITHDPATNGHEISFSPCRESEVYKQLVLDLQRVLLPGRQVIDLMKQYDPHKLEGHVHAITNGDGHGRLVHSDESWQTLEKDGKCIDYMFFSPAMHEQQATPNAENGPRFNLHVVESATQVDFCEVAPLAANLPLPVTHLSDHYGLHAEFALEILTPVTRPDGSAAPHHDRLHELLQLHFPHHAFSQSQRQLWKLKLVVLLMVIGGISGTVLLTISQVLNAAIRGARW